MKVAVTGHSSGIGNALYTLIKHQAPGDHDAIGFSRLTGYDLTNHEFRLKMIVDATDFGASVFVNNAYQPGGMQSDVFEIVKNRWGWQSDKTIVNIISRAAYTGSPEAPDYELWKKTLRQDAQTASFDDHKAKARIINIYPGLTDTQRVKGLTGNKMTAEQVAEQIWWAINSPVNVSELVFGARTDK